MTTGSTTSNSKINAHLPQGDGINVIGFQQDGFPLGPIPVDDPGSTWDDDVTDDAPPSIYACPYEYYPVATDGSSITGPNERYTCKFYN